MRISNRAILSLAGVLFAASSYVFWLLWPALQSFPTSNPIYYRKLWLASPTFISIFVTTIAVASLLIWRRHRLAFTLVAWISVFFLRTPQIMSWHALFLLPILALHAAFPSKSAVSNERRVEQSFVLLVLYFMSLSVVFETSVWPAWIASVLRRLSGG